MKPYQTSFFDESKRLAALSRLGDPLEQLSKYVDFEIFRPVLTEAFQKTDRKSPAGRKPLDVILMFKAMVIQRLFNLSDEQLEFQITVHPQNLHPASKAASGRSSTFTAKSFETEGLHRHTRAFENRFPTKNLRV